MKQRSRIAVLKRQAERRQAATKVKPAAVLEVAIFALLGMLFMYVIYSLAFT